MNTNYLILGAPEDIPDYQIEIKSDDNTIQDLQSDSIPYDDRDNATIDMSIEMDISGSSTKN